MGEPTEISDAELEASEKYLGLLIDAEWIPRDVDESGNCWGWELRARNTRLIVGPAEHAFLAGIAKSASDVIAALRSTRERLAAAEAVLATAEPGISTTPADCTNSCGMGPCNCSGKWRVLSYSVDPNAFAAWRALAHPTTEEPTG